jgi:hypothetical protein
VKAGWENIPEGSKVLAINGFDMSEIISGIKNQIPSDGFNLSYKEFLLNRNFATLFSLYFPAKDTFEVKFQNMDGVTDIVKLPGEAKRGVKDKNPGWASYSLVDNSTTAQLRIPSFAATDQDFPMFLEKTFGQLKTDSIKNLIIDLRNNEGGRDEYGLLLFSYLFGEPFKYYENIKVASIDAVFLNRLNFGDIPFDTAIPDYASNIQVKTGTYFYTNHANLGIHEPRNKTFNGRVYILVNGGTFSTAAEFASLMHSHKRAIFIGEETGGGYYGNSSFGSPILTLPNSKIRISIPIAKYELAVEKTAPAGRGVIPDFSTAYTLMDILENKDKELELCLKIISGDYFAVK